MWIMIVVWSINQQQPDWIEPQHDSNYLSILLFFNPLFINIDECIFMMAQIAYPKI